MHHVAVCVRDLGRAEGFYSGVLGLGVVRRLEDARGEARAIWCELGDGAFLAIERVRGAGEVKEDAAPGWHCVALRIAREERESWRARLAEAGHPVEKETAFTIYVRDPEGSLVGLSHYPDGVDVDD